MDTTFIYALVDPRNEEIFYVGKADVPKRRLKHHLNNSYRRNNARLFDRIMSIKQHGRPTMAILEKCATEAWQDRERFWIKSLKDGGAPLLNVSPGGSGAPHGRMVRHSEKTKAVLRSKNADQFADEVKRNRHSMAMKQWSETITDEIREKVRRGGLAVAEQATENLKKYRASLTESGKKELQTKAHAWMKDVPADYWKQRGEKQRGNSKISKGLKSVWERRKLGLLPARRPKGQGLRRSVN